jgi:serine/threonine-protein kinase RsbW
MDPLTVEARLEALSAIGAYIREAAAQAGLDSRSAYRLRLAVDEVATNVIVHGRPLEHSGDDKIMLTAEIDDGTLTITLEDAGPPFDPSGHPWEAESINKPLEERPIGGLGVFLALKGVDEYQYERVGVRNRSKFIVHRNGAAAGGPR